MTFGGLPEQYGSVHADVLSGEIRREGREEKWHPQGDSKHRYRRKMAVRGIFNRIT
jgi:hypothetical protein